MDDEADLRARARVGTVLDGKWTLERLLGVGGMAAVYAGVHRNGARGAVKVLHPELSRHPEVRERFQREGYAANQVAHPGAVKVMDDDVVGSGPEAGTAYLVMELLEGQSVQDRLEQGPAMTELEFLQLADRVLDVLCAAHAHGVVHRDLKPENLFLLSREAAEAAGTRVKVLDFGLARLLQGQAITTYGLALGTPSFMSPEQAAGRLDEIDGRTDLFALAATGFRVRTGRRIHEAANPVELVTKMAQLPAPPIRSLAPDVSEPFARVVDRALAFRRSDRYASAAEMQTDVRRAIAELDGAQANHRAAPVVSPPIEALGVTEPVGELSTAATIELSRRDLEVVPAAADRPQTAPQPSSADGPARGPQASSAATAASSVSDAPGPVMARAAPRRRKRRASIVPWAALVLFASIGTKLWMDASDEGSGSASSSSESPSEGTATPAATDIGALPSAEPPPPESAGAWTQASPASSAHAAAEGLGSAAPSGSHRPLRTPVPAPSSSVSKPPGHPHRATGQSSSHRG